jgi:aspartate kinase
VLGFQGLRRDANVVKISVIGIGMRSHAGVAKQMFQTLADKGINIQVISTSEIKVSVLIAAEYTELALRALHTAYGLDADAIIDENAEADTEWRKKAVKRQLASGSTEGE